MRPTHGLWLEGHSLHTAGRVWGTPLGVEVLETCSLFFAAFCQKLHPGSFGANVQQILLCMTVGRWANASTGGSLRYTSSGARVSASAFFCTDWWCEEGRPSLRSESGAPCFQMTISWQVPCVLDRCEFRVVWSEWPEKIYPAESAEFHEMNSGYAHRPEPKG